MKIFNFFKTFYITKEYYCEIGFHPVGASCISFDIRFEFSGTHNGFFVCFIYWKNKCFEFNIYDVKHKNN